MAKTFNFADIQRAADEKFGDFEIIVPAEEGEGTETLTFVHLLRKPHEERVAFAEAINPQNYADNAEVANLDTVDGLVYLVKAALRTVARTPRDFDRLEAVIREANNGRDDIGVWEEIFGSYGEHSQMGEA